jgi:hypothetical protein
LDILLGIENIPSFGFLDHTLGNSTSDFCRKKYCTFLQNISSLDHLLLTAEDNGVIKEEEHHIESTSIFPSLSLTDAQSSSLSMSERYQQALMALRTNSQTKTLVSVYQRILKKIQKIEHQLQVIIIIIIIIPFLNSNINHRNYNITSKLQENRFNKEMKLL